VGRVGLPFALVFLMEARRRGALDVAQSGSRGEVEGVGSKPVGADVEKLRATLEQGVLTITVPKKAEVQPKKITVKSEPQAQRS
jgi:HSP20 family molecular chaperone IbpA